MINQDFLKADFRVNRPLKYGMPSTDEFTIERHEILLPRSLIEGKRILDIGSFVGQTADWCLQNGAAGYVGVEIAEEFANTSIQLLNKHHHGKDWAIITASAADYFKQYTDKFDIIFAWGVIYAQPDHVSFLQNLAERGEHIIMTGRHPKVMWRDHVGEISDEFWTKLEYEIPYQEFHNGQMSLLYTENASVRVTSCNSSIGAVRAIMATEGFTATLDRYEDFKQRFPYEFGSWREFDQVGFYILEFFRDAVATATTLPQLHKDQARLKQENVIDWFDTK